MKKAVQMSINDYCEREAKRVNAEESTLRAVGRLRTCSAYVYETVGYYVLCSYNTNVAFIRKADGTCFDVLRLVYGYTNTSAQHIAKFRHDYNATSIETWRKV